MAEQQQQQEDAQARKRALLDAIALECYISPSQEEILRNQPEWVAFESQKENPTDFLPISQETTPTSSHPSAQDHFTVGSHPTIMYTPNDTQNPEEKEEEETQRPTDAKEGDGNDSFDPKFESDRDVSLNTQSQNYAHFPKSSVLNCLIHAHFTSSIKEDLPIPEASSVSSKKRNSNPKKKISPKPASCRRILDKEEKAQTETTCDAKSHPDIVDDSPIDIPMPATQVGAAVRLAQFDSQPALNFSPIGTQLPLNSKNQCLQNYEQTDSPMSFPDNIAEEHGETHDGEGIRVSRILPPYFTDAQDTIKDLENDTQFGLERDSQHAPKRRRKETTPFPETLMDVIMNYSGEHPVGFEDADIVEAAIKAGMTFPPPLSRHCFHT